MEQNKETRLRGIASLFDKAELKSFITGYLIMMGVVEGFIFFVAFLVHLNTEDAIFPWKPYLFSSFIAPLAITFIFGVISIGFNTCLFESAARRETGTDLAPSSSGGNDRFHYLVAALHRLPYLVSLLLIIIGGVVFYKIDAIILYIGRAGEKAAQYMAVSLGVILAVATVGGLLWMWFSYKLRKKKLSFEYQYKRDVMERTGLIILDNDTVVDQSGKPITGGGSGMITHEKSDDDEIYLVDMGGR